MMTTVHDCLYDKFFFFKQKTAYEMRISDWSSDVCSSDLQRRIDRHAAADALALSAFDAVGRKDDLDLRFAAKRHQGGGKAAGGNADIDGGTLRLRSEEHTSELQSLMRISYAVFCLKKKKTTHQSYLTLPITMLDKVYV